MDSSSLIDILNCPKLRRLANFMRTKNKQIGIPVSPNDDVNSIGANLVLGVLQKEIPRKKLRSYLMKIISFDGIASILRNWRSDVGQTVMHFAAAQYDLDFVKLLAGKCGEDLFTVQSNIPNDLPLCHLIKNNLLLHYRQLKIALEYHISKVQNGLSLIRSSIFPLLRSVPSEFTKEIFDSPIIASEITKAEKEAVIAFYRTEHYDFEFRSVDLRDKIVTIFLLSEPSYFQCQQSHLFEPHFGFGSGEPERKITRMLKQLQEINSIKQLTVEDRGYLLSLAKVVFAYISGYFPDITKWTGNRLDDHLRPYVKLLWSLNDVGALPKTPEDITILIKDECEPFLWMLAQQATSGELFLEKYNFWVCDLPPIYQHFINKYREINCGSTSPRSNKDLTFKFPLMDLIDDLMFLICSYLPYRALRALLSTSKRFLDLKNSTPIWRAKFKQYFPYDPINKDYSDTSFTQRYKNKFQPLKIYGSSSAIPSNAADVPFYCNMSSVELIGDEILNTSLHHNRLTLFNLATNLHVSTNDIVEPAAARIYGDKILVMKKNNQIEVRSKNNLEVISQFPRIKPNTTLPHFDISDNWLVSSDGVYDWGTGKVVDVWDQHLFSITVRDQICYGIDGNDIVIKDLRQSDQVIHRVSNSSVDKYVSMNVFDGKIYTAGKSINIFDTRYLQQPASTMGSRSIGPCDPADNYAIDLVNMNVWGSRISWDLIDNKWERADIGDIHNIVDKVCNGKYLAVMYVGVLQIFKLDTPTTFQFGDFKLNKRL